ncbi:MAG: hypothetical protein ACLQIB_48765 [Isosphaeraceae bacterium]
MPAELLKFRCYRCNQLLAVAQSRAGSVVACPRCKAELQIPAGELASKGEPDKAARRQRGSAASNAATSPANAPEMPAFLAEIAGAIPPELAELRPEDLRVEAEVFESIVREPAPPAAPAPLSQPAIETPAESPAAEREREPEVPASELSNLFATTVQPSEPPVAPARMPPVSIEPRAFVPPIEVEPPSIHSTRAEVRRSQEVILPASVVLAWSLFVLLGIAFSFVAGLVIGHFLWTGH